MDPTFNFASQLVKEEGTVSQVLGQRLSQTLDRLSTLPSDYLLGTAPEVIVDRMFADQRCTDDDRGLLVPLRFAIETIQQDLGDFTQLRTATTDEYVGAWWWQLPFRISGSADMIGRWPDRHEGALRTFDNRLIDPVLPAFMWHMGLNGQLFAGCYMPYDEETAASDRTTHPIELFESAKEFDAAYCDAVNRQMLEWKEESYQLLLGRARGQQEVLTKGRESRDRTNELFEQWRITNRSSVTN